MDSSPGGIRILHVDGQPNTSKLVGTFRQQEADRFDVVMEMTHPKTGPSSKTNDGDSSSS